MNVPYELWPIWCDYLEEQGQDTEFLRYVMTYSVWNNLAIINHNFVKSNYGNFEEDKFYYEQGVIEYMQDWNITYYEYLGNAFVWINHFSVGCGTKTYENCLHNI